MMKATQYTARFGRLRVEVDSDEVFKDDPGMGTPVMVITRDDRGREVTATIATQAFTAGKFTVFLYYLMGD